MDSLGVVDRHLEHCSSGVLLWIPEFQWKQWLGKLIWIVCQRRNRELRWFNRTSSDGRRGRCLLGTAKSRRGGRADFVESFFWRKRSYRLVCSCLVYCITTTGMLCKCDARESASILSLLSVILALLSLTYTSFLGDSMKPKRCFVLCILTAA